MNVDLKSLPDDASLPKDIVLSLIDKVEVKYQEKIHYLEEQVRLFKNELFGRTSEKRSEPNLYQLPLVNVDDDHVTENIQSSDDTIVVPAHRRKKRGRKPLPKICRVSILSMILAKIKNSVPAESS